jgi:hypothetical protein
MVFAALLMFAECQTEHLTVRQAQALVLAAPNIQAAIKERGAKPFFASTDTAPGGWGFDVNSATPCLHAPNPCSSLLGHFAVSRDGEVEDLDADGGAGAVISSPQMRSLRERFRTANCQHPR